MRNAKPNNKCYSRQQINSQHFSKLITTSAPGLGLTQKLKQPAEKAKRQLGQLAAKIKMYKKTDRSERGLNARKCSKRKINMKKNDRQKRYLPSGGRRFHLIRPTLNSAPWTQGTMDHKPWTTIPDSGVEQNLIPRSEMPTRAVATMGP